MSEAKKDYFAPMHTAEHILNRTMVNMFGCERSENCHVEKKKSKCDFILDVQPTNEQITEIENIVNKIINQNLKVEQQFLDFDSASKLYKLRVAKEDNPTIRIIAIGDYDFCPCIGQHVSNTSEIGKFKITTTSYENNVFRLRYKLLEDNEE